MHEAPRPPTENRLLAALPPAEYERLASHLEPVKMPLGQILYQAGGAMEHVYFPLNSMISLVSQMADGGSVEIGLADFEGVTGISLVLFKAGNVFVRGSLARFGMLLQPLVKGRLPEILSEPVQVAFFLIEVG